MSNGIGSENMLWKYKVVCIVFTLLNLVRVFVFKYPFYYFPNPLRELWRRWRLRNLKRGFRYIYFNEACVRVSEIIDKKSKRERNDTA